MFSLYGPVTGRNSTRVRLHAFRRSCLQRHSPLRLPARLTHVGPECRLAQHTTHVFPRLGGWCGPCEAAGPTATLSYGRARRLNYILLHGVCVSTLLSITYDRSTGLPTHATVQATFSPAAAPSLTPPRAASSHWRRLRQTSKSPRQNFPFAPASSPCRSVRENERKGRACTMFCSLTSLACSRIGCPWCHSCPWRGGPWPSGGTYSGTGHFCDYLESVLGPPTSSSPTRRMACPSPTSSANATLLPWTSGRGRVGATGTGAAGGDGDQVSTDGTLPSTRRLQKNDSLSNHGSWPGPLAQGFGRA